MARPRKFDETRVLTAAMHAFWQRGYEATSARDLTDCTGLGQSSLYNAFGDKRQLYLRALRRYYETHTAEQTAFLEGPGPVRDRLRALMVHGIDTDLAPDPSPDLSRDPARDPASDPARDPASAPAPGCFAINASVEMADADPDVREEVQRHFGAVEEALREAVARGQRAGEIPRKTDAATLARGLLSTYYGLRVLARVRKDRDALLDVIDSTLAALTTP